MGAAESGTTRRPWLQREYQVILATVLMGYVLWFYIANFGSGVRWENQEASDVHNTRPFLLLGFLTLYLWMVWAFAIAVITPPGFAKDHVPQQGLPRKRCNALSSDQLASDLKGPDQTPILHPESRYCGLDRIVRPSRTHHCSNCETCVLKYDHHCSWIGQCVGARNHKFFVNFLQATSACSLYCLGTMADSVMRPSKANGVKLDALFGFTAAIMATAAYFSTRFLFYHIKLILLGQTTLERFQLQKVRQKQFQNLSVSWWEYGKRHNFIQEWVGKWGDLNTEGNIWWLGSPRLGWEDVMGQSFLGWFLPIGRSQSDGLSYPINPRFDTDGLLKRREEWPEELR